MAGSARLRIEADSADVRRVFGEIVTQWRSTNQTLLGISRRTRAMIVTDFRTLKREFDSVASSIARASQQSAQARRQFESTATKTQERESRSRIRLTVLEEEERKKSLMRLLRYSENLERMQTASARRAAQNRSRFSQQDGGGARPTRTGQGGQSGFSYNSRFGQVAINPWNAGRTFATQMHGQVQDARERRANTTRILNQALFQAGASGSTVAREHERILTFSRDQGIDSSELAEAINAAQTEFSVLGNSRTTQRERAANIDTVLRNALFARNTGQNISEVTRVAGMLEQAGITGDSQRNTLLALTGMAQRGAIELGAVSRTAMGPLQGRMATSLARLVSSNPNATAEQRAQAQQQAVMQTFAEMEVGRGLGMSPRYLGNVMTMLERRISNPNTQQSMLRNIQNSTLLSADQRQHAIDTLYSRDTQGRFQLRSEYARGPYDLAVGFQSAFRGDSEAMSNVFAGGGHGNPQSLQANWRNVLALLMGGGGVGTSADRIAELMRTSGTAFTEIDAQRGASIFARDDRTELTRNEETRVAALRDNTSAITRLSDRFANFASQNPGTATALSAGTAGVSGGFFGRAGTFAINGAGASGGGAASAAGGIGASGLGSGAVAAGAGVLAPAAALGLTVAGVGAASYLFNEQVQAQTGTTLSQRAGAAWQQMLGNSTQANQLADQVERRQQQTNTDFSNDRRGLSRDVVGRALGTDFAQRPLQISEDSLQRLAQIARENPSLVQIDPHDAEHLASAANSQQRVNGTGN